MLFSSDPEIDISIICYDPDFYGPTENTISDHTQSDNPTTTLIPYEGTSDTGFIFNLNVDRAISDIILVNTTSDSVQRRMELTSAFIPGDVITVNTNPGSKSVTLTRAGITSSILYFMNPLSTWPILQMGDNNFAAYATGPGISSYRIFVFLTLPKFGGI